MNASAALRLALAAAAAACLSGCATSPALPRLDGIWSYAFRLPKGEWRQGTMELFERKDGIFVGKAIEARGEFNLAGAIGADGAVSIVAQTDRKGQTPFRVEATLKDGSSMEGTFIDSYGWAGDFKAILTSRIHVKPAEPAAPLPRSSRPTSEGD